MTFAVARRGARRAPAPPPPRALGSRFALLWAGQSASLIGDQITLIALPLVAVGYAAGSTFDVGLLGLCLRLPFLLIGLPAGVWVARLGLTRSMIAADLLRGVAIGVLPLAVWAGSTGMTLLFAVALLVGIGTVFFQVSYQSLVPDLIGDQQLWHAANTRLSLSESTALLVGPALGGVIVAWCAPPGALLVDASTYVVSVVTLLLIAGRHRARPVVCRPADGSAPSLRSQITAGLRYVRRTPVLNSIMWVGATYNLGSAMYDSLLVIFAVHDLKLSPAQLGLAVSVGGIGFPLGSLVSGRINARLGVGPALIAAAVPSVGGLFVGAFATGLYPALFLGGGTFLVGLGQGCFAVNAISLRQLTASAAMRARATAVHRFASWGALPVGSLLAGLVGQTLGIRAAMITAAILSATCFRPLLASPLRKIHTGRPGDRAGTGPR